MAGSGYTNEALLTGESRLVPKCKDKSLYGGSTLTKGTILMKMTKTAENSSIA